jgi:regulator of sirC expression with transglutaminase-like and TPR domain
VGDVLLRGFAEKPRGPRYHPTVINDDAARTANRARFARLIAQPEADIDLARGALAIAADGRPDIDASAVLATLDELAERVRLRLDVGDAETHVIDRLQDVLFRESGFRGPTAAEYHDPLTSLLDVVVARRVGLPISLAIVELEVAWRIGLALVGIGLPGHFILGAPGGALLDPADDGRRLTPDDCQALLRRSIGDGILFHAGMLRPNGKREILARVLRNLRSAHLAARDWPAALGAVELLAVIEPIDPDHGRDRGLLLGRMGRFGEAVVALDRYLHERPDGHDVADVRQVLGIFAGRRN